jgi:adhesin PapG
MIKSIILGIPVLLSPIHVLADYRHFVWVPETHASITVPNVVVDDKTLTVRGVARGGLSGDHNAIVALSRCSGTNDNLQGSQSKNSWLILPDSVSFRGSQIKLNIRSDNGWNPAMGSPNAGWTAKVYQTGSTGKLYGCWKQGEMSRAEFTWSDANIDITIPRQSLQPGSYSIPVPYYYAFEEHKHTPGDISNAGDIAALIQNDPRAKSTFYINLTVSSHCELNSVGVTKIDLSHGTISSNDLGDHKSPPYNLNMKCRPGTSVTISLTGMKPVTGKTKNFTSCGSGTCELNIDGDKYNETYLVNESGIIDLPVTSTFRLDKNNIVEGPFTGSGVLSISIN